MNNGKIDIVYPNGARKAVTMRFDDGAVSDRKLVELLNRYGLKATFYLCGGFMTRDTHIGVNEAKTLYRGHEIANHTFTHVDQRVHAVPADELLNDLVCGKQFLEQLFEQQVTGYAYVCSTFGAVGEDEYKRILKETGHTYAVMGRENRCFVPDAQDAFNVGQSFRFSDPDLIEKAKEYCKSEQTELSWLFTMAHSFEFDKPRYPYGWDKVRDFFSVISRNDDIWHATNGEVVSYLLSVNEFLNSKSSVNTTGVTIYYKHQNKVLALENGQSL